MSAVRQTWLMRCGQRSTRLSTEPRRTRLAGLPCPRSLSSRVRVSVRMADEVRSSAPVVLFRQQSAPATQGLARRTYRYRRPWPALPATEELHSSALGSPSSLAGRSAAGTPMSAWSCPASLVLIVRYSSSLSPPRVWRSRNFVNIPLASGPSLTSTSRNLFISQNTPAPMARTSANIAAASATG